MHDLVGAFERLDEVYRMYVESAFPFRYPALDQERRAVLQEDAVLSQEPLVEPVPVYPSSGKTLVDIAKELGADYAGVETLARGLLPPDATLHEHQWRSLRAVLQDKKDLLVTTGTGSGKTECFVLPLLAELVRESSSWALSAPSTDRFWWRNGADRVSQWKHSLRPHAVRALVLYPLNALVEDQLRRLRMTLDSPASHEWLDNQRGGNRLLFGRYTGQTPVSSQSNSKAAERRLRQSLERMDRSWSQIEAALEDPNFDEDIRYHFPRPDGGEMWSRWDMQDTPPDILITNYSMLNIMLMREVEDAIFVKTKNWLSDSEDNTFFLVVDELHSYRGTPGTEVAYILRLLLDRIGLSPSSKQLRILSTSASLESGPQASSYLREFFGRDNRFELVSEGQVLPEEGAHRLLRPYAKSFATFATTVQAEPLKSMSPPDFTTEESSHAMLHLAEELGTTAVAGEQAKNVLGQALVHSRALDAVRDACQTVNGTVRATRVSQMGSVLFPTGSKEDAGTAADAIRGLLLATGVAEMPSGQSPLPVRGHLFFHNLQNMWVCTNPDCTEVKSRRTATNEELLAPCGALQAHHKMTCACGARVLDLVVCSSCGEVFYGGFSKSIGVGSQPAKALTPDQPDLESLPDHAGWDRTHGSYAIFWPVTDKPENDSYSHNRSAKRWVTAVLDAFSGIAICQNTPPAQGYTRGWLFVADKADESAFPPICPRCGTDYRRAKADSPLRHHRTGFQRSSQVLASALAREMPDSRNGRNARKLVVFSDSRQDAAKLAAGMELDHFRDMVRVALIGAHQLFVSGYAEILARRCASSTDLLENVRDINPVLAREIGSGQLQGQAPAFAKSFRQWNKDLILNLYDAAESGESLSVENVDLMWGYPARVPLRNIRDIVWDRLLALGICPGGTRSNSLVFEDGRERKQWWQCFDWSTLPPQPRKPLTPAEEQHVTEMRNHLMSELMLCLFPHATRTFESLNLGFATFRFPEGSDPTLVQACQAVVRSLCNRKSFRYWDRFFLDPQGQDRNLQKFILPYIASIGLSEAAVKSLMKRSQVWLNGENNPGIDSNNLWLEIPSSQQPGDLLTKGWSCPTCGAYYMHAAAGRCLECNVPLEHGHTHASLDYYRYLAEKAADGFRFRSEELTGQTDSVDRPRRQRWFQEVFLPSEGEIPAVHGLDLLSVTTTMEAGVDIGALLAVMMANMPPQRFNYQQRVGRAGRRGGGLSVAVTFCRGRSHDDFYYRRPEAITGDPPPLPYVDTRQLEILKRVVAKEVLRRGFLLLGASAVDTDSLKDSVHGEFGPVSNWPAARPRIEEFLLGKKGLEAINQVTECLITGTSWGADSEARRAIGLKMRDFSQKELLPEIDRVVADDRFTETALSERLASAGILPMFGFPTRVRLLFTTLPRQGNPWPPEHGTVDRELDIAISQFAPGSETVKDKRVYTAAGVADLFPAGPTVGVRPGLTPPLLDANNLPIGNSPVGVCRSCQAMVRFEQNSAPPLGEQAPGVQECPICGQNTMQVIDAREPKSFFCGSSHDFDGTFEWMPRASRPMIYVSPDTMYGIDGTNVKLHSSATEVISINDNGGQGGFDLAPVSLPRANGAGAYATRDDYKVSESTTAYRIALLSRRYTDVMIIDLAEWPNGIYADPRTVEGRAAWYSFAFLLRTCAATLLDVDLQELQAGIRTLIGPEGPRGQAFLSDTLENGAGYCRWLAADENFTALLASVCDLDEGQVASKWTHPEHALRCDTSCNDCLRDFRNMQYHGLLDWRLALDMARLAQAERSEIALSQSTRTPTLWARLVDGAGSPIARTLKQFGYESQPQLDHPCFVSPKRRRMLVASHPLWTQEHPRYASVAAEATKNYPGFTIDRLSPFTAVRRPGDYL